MNTMTRSIRRQGATRLRAPRRALALVVLAGAFAVAGCQTGDSLVGTAWRWTAVEGTSTAGEADPERYGIEFLLDGTVRVQVDCNSLGGRYAVGVPLDLTINLATTTMAACADPSLDAVYLESLSRVAGYSTANGVLSLELADDAGTLRFTTGGS